MWWLELLSVVFFGGLAMAGYPCCCKFCECCRDANPPQARAKTQYTITFSGVANGTCTDCNDWNTTAFIVPGYFKSGAFVCQWDLETGLPCGFDLLSWALLCESPGTGLQLFQGQVLASHPSSTINGDGGYRKYASFNPTVIDCSDPGAHTNDDSFFRDNDFCDWSGGSADVA